MANEFKPSVGGKVSKEEADKWIEKYEKDIRKDKAKDTKSVFYGRDVLLEILSKDGCAGISFFFCLKPNEDVGKDTLGLVLVGTKQDGTLMSDGDTGSTPQTDTTYTTYDSGASCPPYCPK